MRLPESEPYHVVMLFLEIERQRTSARLPRLDQRSMRAKSPSMRGRYRSMRKLMPFT